MPVRFLALVLVVIAAGCNGRAEPPASALTPAAATALAAQVAAAQGRAEHLRAVLTFRVKPMAGDSLIFSVDAWLSADGRSRLDARKAGVPFLSALLAADGTLTLRNDRSGAWAQGRLAELPAEAPPFLRDAPLLRSELLVGSLDPDRPVSPGPDATTLHQDTAAGPAILTIDAGNRMVADKRLLARDGAERIRLAYGRHQDCERLRRPTAITLAIAGDDTAYAVRFAEWSRLPGIDAERFALVPPPDCTLLNWADFLRELGK